MKTRLQAIISVYKAVIGRSRKFVPK